MTIDPWLAASALVAALTFGVHLFAGGAEVARPLLDSADLPRLPRETLYFVWHMVSWELAVLAIALGYCAVYDAANRPLVWTLAGLAGGSGMLNLGLAAWRRVPLTLLIQWALLLPIAVLALVGVHR
jgi:hypothetical protein